MVKDKVQTNWTHPKVTSGESYPCIISSPGARVEPVTRAKVVGCHAHDYTALYKIPVAD